MVRITTITYCLMGIIIATLAQAVAAQPPGVPGRDRYRREGDRQDRNRQDRNRQDSGERSDDSGRSRGGERGDRGGFDPVAILERMDANGNGRLDPDEVDGRARYFIQRFAPNLDTSRSNSFEDIRKQLKGTGGGGQGGNRENQSPTAALDGIEPLVPGFDYDPGLPPIPGFGTLGEFFAVDITAEDEQEAADVLRRYDRDGDGMLDSGEMRRGRWYDDPTAYDQNRDGKLSQKELAVRYARKRAAKDGQSGSDETRDDEDRDTRRTRKDRGGGSEESAQSASKSYRFLTAHERLADDLPSWFKEKDKDLDGQVSMSEFASTWDGNIFSQFDELDANGDGLITPSESQRSSGDATTTSTNNSSDASSGESTAEVEVPSRYLNWATSTIKKYDQDEDGLLSEQEMKEMRRPPVGADTDGDNKISPAEFARSVMPKTGE